MNRGAKYDDRRSWDRFDSPEYDRLPPRRRRYSDDRAGEGYTPELFRSLRLSDVNPRVPDQQVREVVYAELKRFGEFNVKFAHTVDRRLVYVNFAYPEDALAAKQALTNRLFLFERPVCVEAVYNKQAFYRHDNGKDLAFYRGGSPYLAAPRRHSDTFDPYPPPSRYDGFDDGHYHNSIRKEQKFPYHLNHIPPEEDEKATRTLFVGNIDHDMTPEEISKYFEPYGVVEDVNIKHPSQGGGNPYAFVRFFHLDMAYVAKVKLSGGSIGRSQCKIGYGKPAPTCCVWVGGIGSWVGKHTLGKEFERFGRIMRIEWPFGCSYAFVEYDSVETARTAIHEMRGFMFRGAKRGIRVDFAELRQMDEDQPAVSKSFRRSDGEKSSRRRRSKSFSRTYSSDDEFELHSRKPSRNDSLDKYKRSKEGKRSRKERLSDDNSNYSANLRKKRRRSASFTDSDSACSHFDVERNLNKKEKVFQIGNVEAAETVLDLARCLPIVWSGSLMLKNSQFSTRMHLVYGDAHLVDTLMRDPTSTERPSLKITQRLRMDLPKLEEVERRISLSGDGGWCILLVMPGSNDYEDINGFAQQRPLKNLVSYLRQKDAAGVLSLPPTSKHGCETGLLHTFPPCKFAHHYLLKYAPRLVSDFTSEDHIIVFLVRVNI